MRYVAYTSKLKIKTSSVNVWRSLCWWPDLSDCLITSSISQGRPQKKPADHNCWDDGKARWEDLGWQSEDVVWRRHWRQTGRGRRGMSAGCADSWTPWGRAWTRPAPVHRDQCMWEFSALKAFKWKLKMYLFRWNTLVPFKSVWIHLLTCSLVWS